MFKSIKDISIMKWKTNIPHCRNNSKIQMTADITIQSTTVYQLRNGEDIIIPFCRLSITNDSYIPSTIRQWNNLDLCQQSFQIMCYVYRFCHLILELFPPCGTFVIFHFFTIFVIYIKNLRLSHISPRVINICFKISLKLIKICSKVLKIFQWWLFFWFFDWILELFLQCGMFVFHFIILISLILLNISL
jgi:hypothetical protein